MPTIYVYLSKDQKDFRKTITRALEDSTKKQSVSLADSELIALTKHLLGKSKMLKKYKDVKIQEIIEILSCVDKAMKIKNNQIPIGFETQEQVDKLLGQVTRVKGKVFDDATNSFYSEYQSPKNRSQNYDKPFKNDYFTD
uniref:Uncharacterized protein n=1 Tax=Gracilaria firma TaxID=2510791 RepID=A0A1P8D6K0_9FLOR|nr:hypothetical protein [Gracilaria firma]APR74434.1 hypothetical protein [Gracilaria firma]